MPAITDVSGLLVGHAQDDDARTGCTVLLGPFRAACDIRGLATGTRELDALSTLHIVPRVDAILLTGGSAYGLGAADGVVSWLREHGRGFDVGIGIVPIVPAAVIFDLGVGRADRWPDPDMGRAACDAAGMDVAEGAVGAGTGATVGKLLGPGSAVAGGVGTWSAAAGPYTVGALAVVNALGDVRGDGGEIVAGARDEAGAFADGAARLRELWPEAGPAAWAAPKPGTNTTLAAVATDAPLDRPSLEKLGRIAGGALVRRVTPANTPFDGDVTFALSTADPEQPLPAHQLMALGVVATHVLERAIERAVTAS